MRHNELLKRWLNSANPKSWMYITIAIIFAIAYAIGTGSSVFLTQWLIENSKQQQIKFTYLESLAIIAILLRPLFFIGHVKNVTLAVSDQISNVAQRGTMRLLTTLIIITRDVPTVIVLLFWLIWTGKLIGLTLGLIALSGLALAILVQKTRRIRTLSKTHESDNRHIHTINTRMSRAWGESVADAPLFLILVGLVFALLFGFQLPINEIAAIIINALLLSSPMRRISRIIGG
jgi:hypothetical protein